MLLWWWWCDVSILLEHWGSSCDSTPSGSGEPARSTPARESGCSGSEHLKMNERMRWGDLRCLNCFSYLHSTAGWTSGKHSRQGRGWVVSWWQSLQGTSRPCWALPAAPGSAAQTSDRWVTESRPAGYCASWIISVSVLDTGGIISHLWWMWSSINISDQESCSSFIWSSTCSTRKKRLF